MYRSGNVTKKDSLLFPRSLEMDSPKAPNSADLRAKAMDSLKE